jgi:hypothetical protein
LTSIPVTVNPDSANAHATGSPTYPSPTTPIWADLSLILDSIVMLSLYLFWKRLFYNCNVSDLFLFHYVNIALNLRALFAMHRKEIRLKLIPVSGKGRRFS